MYITAKLANVAAARESNSPLFPRTKASPYSRRLAPLTYSSVFSNAMFMYPSTDCSSPVAVRFCRSLGHGSFLTLVDDARVQLDNDGVSDDIAQKAGRVLALALRDGAVFGTRHGDAVFAGEIEVIVEATLPACDFDVALDSKWGRRGARRTVVVCVPLWAAVRHLHFFNI